MARQLPKWLGLSAALFAVLPPCFAQKLTVIPLVPAANWRQVDSQNLGVDAIRKYGGDPVIEREYGVKILEHRTYQLGRSSVEVTVEPASDASAAYGLLTYYQTESMVPEKGIQLAVTGSDGSMMVRGRNFIRFLRAKDFQVSENDFRALLIFVGGTRPSREALANLPPPLPPQGLVRGSEKYVLGPEAARRVLPSFRTDLLGFDQGAEVHVGDYLSDKARPTVIAISYPTPQIARVRFNAMTGFLGINQEGGPGSLYGTRRGSFVFLVLNADGPATATKLMDQFKVAQRVSWNERYRSERSFTLELIGLLLANFLLILILAGICILGGVLVFLSKRVAARLFPEWQWGRPDGETLIRLNLS